MTSRLREFILGDMLLMEEAADNREKALTLSYSMLGPNVDRKRYREVMDDYMNRLEEIVDLRGYDMYGKRIKKEADLDIFEKLVRDFQRMKEDGTIAAFNEAVERLNREAQPL